MAAGMRGSVELRPFVSTLAAAWVREQPDRTHRRLDGSLVSADLSGFTALSERLAERGKRGAEDLTAMVNACFTSLIRAAAADGGDVLKFGGDAILVWFDGAGHPTRAARAAARMQRVIGGARFRRAGLSMSVGAHVGSFDHFLVGRPEWRELVVVGEPVSTTVDLEAAATAGQVLLSRELASAIPGSWLGNRVDRGVLLAIEEVEGTGGRIRQRPAPEVDPAAARRLVAPSLQEHLAALAGTSGEHRLATVVFTELEGTDAAVADGVDAFAASVDGLVRSVEDIADRYGLLFLYTDVIADGLKLIAVAGAPTSGGDDEEAGLRFATELVRGDPKHKLRVGVNRGRVFAGFLGSEDRRTYTVMGDPVNLAARLMARAEPGEVLGSDDVVRGSRAEFDTVAVAPFLVKGKSRPVNAFRVGAATGRRLAAPSGTLPIVGREHEIHVLQEAIASAADGIGQVVEVVGDAGIGKTRLIQAITDDPRVLVHVATECQPYDSLSPFAAVRPLLRRALGIDGATSPLDAGHRLRSVAERLAPEVVPFLPLVALPLGADVAPTPASEAVAEEFRQARMHTAVVDLLTSVLRTSTLLVVEDIYYVDDASLQLLRAIAGAAVDRPWAFVITRRPEGAGLVVGEVPGTLLKLSPLDQEAAVRLAEVAAQSRPIDGRDLDVLAERSGGNPLFALELVEAAGSGVATEDLPESIERLVATRVDRLEPADRALLRQAAVVGRVFHAGVVNTLLAVEGGAVVRAEQWDRLSEFVEPDGTRRWRFRHALFRDVAYEGLPYARRKRMHRSVGELLEAGVAGVPDAPLLSMHFWLGGDAERTWRYSVEAAEGAWSAGAIGECIAALRRAVDVRRRVERPRSEVAAAWERLGDALERAARYDESEAAYVAAGRLQPRGPGAEGARRLRKLGIVAERRGRYALAVRRYGLARRCCSPGDAAEHARILLALAAARHRQGDHLALLRLSREAEVLAAASGDVWLESAAANSVQVAVTHGAAPASIDGGLKALRGFREVGDVLYEGKALNNLGIECYFRGRWTDAIGYYEQARDAFLRAGDIAEAATISNNLGEVFCDQGRLEEARDELTHALRRWTASSFAIGIGLALTNLGRTESRAGRFAEAFAHLDEAVTRFREIGAQSFELEALTRVAEAHIFAGEPEPALELLGDVIDADATPFPATRACSWRVLGSARLQVDDVEGGVRALVESSRLASENGIEYEASLAARLLAEVARRGRSAGHVEVSLDQRVVDQLGVVAFPEIPLPF